MQEANYCILVESPTSIVHASPCSRADVITCIDVGMYTCTPIPLIISELHTTL